MEVRPPEELCNWQDVQKFSAERTKVWRKAVYSGKSDIRLSDTDLPVDGIGEMELVGIFIPGRTEVTVKISHVHSCV